MAISFALLLMYFQKDLAEEENRAINSKFLRHPVEEAFNEFVSVETAKSESFATK